MKCNVFQISVLEGSSALRKRDTSPQSGTGGGGKQVGFSTCQYDSLEEEQIPPVPSAGRTGSCQKLLLSSRSVSRDGAPAPSEKSEGYFSSISTSTAAKSSLAEAASAGLVTIEYFSSIFTQVLATSSKAFMLKSKAFPPDIVLAGLLYLK